MREKVIYYTFKGWKNSESEKKFHGYLEFYDQEMRAKRATPLSPPGMFVIDPIYGKRTNEEASAGTRIGTLVEVMYFPEYITEADVENYISTIDCILEKINPQPKLRKWFLCFSWFSKKEFNKFIKER